MSDGIDKKCSTITLKYLVDIIETTYCSQKGLVVYYRLAIVDCFRFNFVISKYFKFRHFLFLFVDVLVSDGNVGRKI